MSDTPEILALLSRIEAKVDRLIEDMRVVKQKFGFLSEQYASISRRVDSLDARIATVGDRIDDELRRRRLYLP